MERENEEWEDGEEELMLLEESVLVLEGVIQAEEDNSERRIVCRVENRFFVLFVFLFFVVVVALTEGLEVV